MCLERARLLDMPSLTARALNRALRRHVKGRREKSPNRGPESTVPIEKRRAGFERMMNPLGDPIPTPGIARSEARLAGRDALVFRPKSFRGRRTILYLHGGGFVIGSPRSHENLTARIARQAEAEVWSLDYRLAPEHPFPAGLEDASAALRELADRVGARHLVIGGDSAGGGLTLGTLMRLRDEGGPLPAFAFAFSPWADLTLTAPSMSTRAALDVITNRDILDGMASMYLPEGAAPDDPLASPVFGRFEGLPPLHLQVGDAEVLRDDSFAVARAARQAGVDASLELWPSMPHVFQAIPVYPEARRAVRRLGGLIRARVPLG